MMTTSIVLEMDDYTAGWLSDDSVDLSIFEDRDDDSIPVIGATRTVETVGRPSDSAEQCKIDTLLLWSGKKKSRKTRKTKKNKTHWKEIDFESGKCRSMEEPRVHLCNDKKQHMRRKKTGAKHNSGIKSAKDKGKSEDTAMVETVDVPVANLVHESDPEEEKEVDQVSSFHDSLEKIFEAGNEMKKKLELRDDSHYSSFEMNSGYRQVKDEKAAVAIMSKEQQTVTEAQLTVLTALLRSTQAEKAKSETKLTHLKERLVGCEAERAKREKQIAEMAELLLEMEAENALLRGRVSTLEQRSRTGYA